MKKLGLFFSAVVAMVAVSCASTNKEANEAQAEEQSEAVEQILPVEGYWRLVDYIGKDGSMNEVPTDAKYFLSFDTVNHNFGMTTDCNVLGGMYETVNDSIKFDNIASTLMMCHDTTIEDAMKSILPRIDTYAINPDSILRLRSDMRIMATFVKTTEEEALGTTTKE